MDPCARLGIDLEVAQRGSGVKGLKVVPRQPGAVGGSARPGAPSGGSHPSTPALRQRGVRHFHQEPALGRVAPLRHRARRGTAGEMRTVPTRSSARWTTRCAPRTRWCRPSEPGRTRRPCRTGSPYCSYCAYCSTRTDSASRTRDLTPPRRAGVNEDAWHGTLSGRGRGGAVYAAGVGPVNPGQGTVPRVTGPATRGRRPGGCASDRPRT